MPDSINHPCPHLVALIPIDARRRAASLRYRDQWHGDARPNHREEGADGRTYPVAGEVGLDPIPLALCFAGLLRVVDGREMRPYRYSCIDVDDDGNQTVLLEAGYEACEDVIVTALGDADIEDEVKAYFDAWGDSLGVDDIPWLLLFDDQEAD